MIDFLFWYAVISITASLIVLWVGGRRYKAAVAREQKEFFAMYQAIADVGTPKFTLQEDGFILTLSTPITFQDGSGYYIGLEGRPSLDEATKYAFDRLTRNKCFIGPDRSALQWNGHRFARRTT